MSDGQRSGRLTGKVSCKSTELKRCSMIEMRWNIIIIIAASPLAAEVPIVSLTEQRRCMKRARIHAISGSASFTLNYTLI